MQDFPVPVRLIWRVSALPRGHFSITRLLSFSTGPRYTGTTGGMSWVMDSLAALTNPNSMKRYPLVNKKRLKITMFRGKSSS
jgi:hypothetical protein